MIAGNLCPSTSAFPSTALRVGCRAADRAEHLAAATKFGLTRCEACGSPRIGYGHTAKHRRGWRDSLAFENVCRDCGRRQPWHPRADTLARSAARERRKSLDLTRASEPDLVVARRRVGREITRQIAKQARAMDRAGLEPGEIARDLQISYHSVRKILDGRLEGLFHCRCPRCGGSLSSTPCQACAEDDATVGAWPPRPSGVGPDPLTGLIDLAALEDHWLSAPIAELSLPPRIMNGLEDAGVFQVDALLAMTPEQFLRIPNFKDKVLAVVREAIPVYLGRLREALHQAEVSNRAALAARRPANCA